MLGPHDCWAELPRSYEARAETDLIVHRTDMVPVLGVLETHRTMAMDLLGIIARLNLPADTGADPR